MVQFGKATIVHGDRTLVVVEQGRIGYALDKGQPVLLPPGMHQWQSSTQIFEKLYDLNNNLVRARHSRNPSVGHLSADVCTTKHCQLTPRARCALALDRCAWGR